MPDLPHDEAGELRAACDAEGLALVPLVAPTSTPERVRAIGTDARGFVYAVSLTGTTGERNSLPDDLGATIERVRGASRRCPWRWDSGSRPRRRPARWRSVADGVIVGTRVVRAADEGGPAAVGALVAELAAALR